MNRKLVTSLMVALMAVCFVSVAVYAGTQAPDTKTMKTKGYAKHTKGLVTFSHKAHAEKYGIACGECHHDDKGAPLALKGGESVQGCVVCHKETAKAPKGEKLSKKDKIVKYHKEALHANCIGCHKAFNKKNGFKSKDPKAAPQSCKDCHPKKG